MKLQPYNITLHVYAENQEEANELEAELRDFVIKKYNKGIYPRAAALSNLVKRYGDSMLVDNFIR